MSKTLSDYYDNISTMKSKTTLSTKRTNERPEQYRGRLQDVSQFSDLSDEQLRRFQSLARSLSYKKGKVLYIQGDLAENFYVICSGWIKLFNTMPEGDEIIVDMLRMGDLVGESAIFDHGCYTSSAQAVADIHLLSLPLDFLKEQIHDNPKLALNMLSSMSRHHRRQYGAIAFNALQSAPQRIGCFLLSLFPEDEKKNVVFHLPYDKNLIADILGMKGATFSRAMNILRQKTGIRLIDTRVEIDAVEPLLKFVYGPLAIRYAPEKM